MNNDQVLFYFTDSWPYGLGESWKTNELAVLSSHFIKIFVVPLWYNGNKTPVQMPSVNIEVLDPPFENLDNCFVWTDLFQLFKMTVFREACVQKALFNKSHLKKCLLFAKLAGKLKQTTAYRFVSRNSNINAVWYFFWARGWADILPFVSKPLVKKIAIRMHGYDLYLERNNGYIPFRQALLEKADLLLPISEIGKRYLLGKFEIESKKVVVARLGTTSKGTAMPGRNDILNLVSCCIMVSVKRMDRIVDALKLVRNTKIKWVHIGDGPLMAEVRNAAKSLPDNIKVSFVGKLSAENVQNYYLTNEVDLFINTSESEGVPISVMEALSASIPVIATNVGGTYEIVDDSVGKLLPADPQPETIANELEWYFRLSPEEKTEYRQRAYQRYNERCNAREWAEFLLCQLC